MDQDDASSMVSNAKTGGGLSEASDSGPNNYFSRSNKRSRSHHQPENVGPASARFKGVVPHNNGRSWGAQIYAKHQRVWLGTFKSEKEAAMAYDSASIKLRSSDSPRNFPWTEESVKEPDFQNLFSDDAVLRMIRDGSYRSKFNDFLKSTERKEINVDSAGNNLPGTLLFQKELTPSDVGKLNRLVIPKKYAVKYFPYINENDAPASRGGKVEDVEVSFLDKEKKEWRFRYCYWRSSQSFVLTRGWNKFVKNRELREKDVIVFYSCRDKLDGKNYVMIDVMKNPGEQGSNEEDLLAVRAEVVKSNVEIGRIDNGLENGRFGVGLELTLGNDDCNCITRNFLDEGEKREFKKLKVSEEKKMFRLFGVQIPSN